MVGDLFLVIGSKKENIMSDFIKLFGDKEAIEKDFELLAAVTVGEKILEEKPKEPSKEMIFCSPRGFLMSLFK